MSKINIENVVKVFKKLSNSHKKEILILSLAYANIHWDLNKTINSLRNHDYEDDNLTMMYKKLMNIAKLNLDKKKSEKFEMRNRSKIDLENKIYAIEKNDKIQAEEILNLL